MRARSFARLLPALFAPLLGCGDETVLPPVTEPPPPATVDDIMAELPQSCSFECGGSCTEPAQAFACTTIGPWSKLPHADACGAWDGKYPDPVAGKCYATEPVGEAARPAGPHPNGGLILPDGHRLHPAGREVLFDEPDLSGGFPMSLIPLADAPFALVSDGGIQDNALRLVDLDALAGGGAPVASYVPFARPSSLFLGMAFLPLDRALASGGGDGMVYAFDVDLAGKTIARAKDRDITLAPGKGGDTYYAGPIAVTKDGARLVVAPSDHASEIQVFSLMPDDYGTKVAAIGLPPGNESHFVFDLARDPFDPNGQLFYATDQSRGTLVEIDLAQGKVTRSIAVEKNPAQVVFLDATYALATQADGDAIAVVDRAAGMVAAQVPVFEKDAPHGFSPTGLAYDPATKRLYAALAGVNAVEAFDVTPGSPPALAPAGRIPTAWWPTGVMVAPDGALIILNGKGHGSGTDKKPYPWGQGPITDRMHGSIQRVPAAELADLSALSATVESGRAIDKLPGRSTVVCPGGAADFPIPETNENGPSAQIKHVILVVRENKTFDAVFGDRKDLGDGDPSLIMASDPSYQAAIWQNARSIAQQFTNFDNFYTDAEQSIQGHTWTVYGRTTDTMERTWLTIWGRASRTLATPTLPLDTPKEGGVFSWFNEVGIGIENMGEIIGNAAPDGRYPGLLYAQSRPDIDKSCYLGGRLRLECNLAPFTYALQTNDHTYGGSAGSPAPEVMIAVNDEASGLLLDALSHSPYWKDSLLIITEDDPQDGGDHVDLHRSLLFMASPWIKRGYVSHGHYDMASVYKLVAHIYGIPYHNDMMRNALLPLDAFTSTPDYTPYTYLPRTVTAPCNAESSAYAKEAERWDFDDLDDQPGLSQQIMKMMKESPKDRGVKLIPPHH
ncbi:MAG: alkaline phosphatase family protein [Byssovorax sp.]